MHTILNSKISPVQSPGFGDRIKALTNIVLGKNMKLLYLCILKPIKNINPESSQPIVVFSVKHTEERENS